MYPFNKKDDYEDGMYFIIFLLVIMVFLFIGTIINGAI
jgi:hypothetical protein